MGPTNPAFDASAETYQEGVTPVQEFTSRAIPISPGAVLQPRLGRPLRTDSAEEQADRVPESGAS